MGPDDVDARRASFLAVGDEYERTRPDYPVASLEWLFGTAPARILDLGCGPGKLTAQLVAVGHDAVGADPSTTMLRSMRAKGLLAVCSNAEEIPFRDRSFDSVAAAQAFHWFDHDRAVPEMHRVLRRGGTVALLWNLRDESVAWVRRLSEIIGSDDATSATLGAPEDFEASIASVLTRDGYFSDVESRIFEHGQRLTAGGLVDLVRSRSYVAVLPEREREVLLGRVAELCREDPALSGKAHFTLPYRTVVFRGTAT